MKIWFLSLQERERILVCLGAAAIILSALWFGLWVPLDNGHRTTSERVNIWERSITALRPLKNQIQSTGNNPAPRNNENQSLIVIVDTTIRQRGLTQSLQRSQPTPTGDGIRVEFQNATFDDLMLWIGDLHRQYGLQLESGSFSMASGSTAGRVNSTVTLQF
ncbi:MAG: hypothetical protein CMO98_06630 [Woeseia sp.]|nr:hypothetical protein [Woeseia sp.]|tara:strand:+ start:537 stop:1022 length:486 start_codon:yes stop_codon:yes gene_type:complete